MTTGAILLWRRREAFHLPRWWVRLDRRRLHQILRIGIPQGGAILIYFGAMLMVFSLVGVLGAPAVSAIGVGIRQVEFVGFTCYLGVNAAAATIVGQCIGARKLARAGQAAWIASGVAAGIGAVAMHVMALFHEPLAAAFAPATADPAAQINIATYIWAVSFSQVPLAIDIALGGVFIGAGRTVFPLVMNIVALSSRVVLVWWLLGAGFGFPSVCWAIAATSVVKGILMCIAFQAGWWRPTGDRT